MDPVKIQSEIRIRIFENNDANLFHWWPQAKACGHFFVLLLFGMKLQSQYLTDIINYAIIMPVILTAHCFRKGNIMDNTEIQVRQITGEEANKLMRDYNQTGQIDLGGRHDSSALRLEWKIDELLADIKDSAELIFLLTWEGNKVPRGAKVFDFEIAGTQHGQVLSSTGEDIGSYDRIEQFAGPDHNQQKMIVYIHPFIQRRLNKQSS